MSKEEVRDAALAIATMRQPGHMIVEFADPEAGDEQEAPADQE